jgi:DNA-binding PadR family transcriptional regulator
MGMKETTTQSALLGMLSLRSWGSYELVKEMGRNLRYFWPRAESRIYAELNRLKGEKLATSKESSTGERSRQTWSISATGRHALKAWLRGESGETTLQCEDLLRIFLAQPEDTRTLASSIQRIRAEAEELSALANIIAHEYQTSTAPFQERVRARALVFDFLASWAHMRIEWAKRAQAYLAKLEDLDASAGDRVAVEHIRQRHRALRSPR